MKFYFLPLLPMWQQWANGVLGIWLIIEPFLGLTTQQNTWALAITGVAIVVLAFWGVAEHATMYHRGMRHA